MIKIFLQLGSPILEISLGGGTINIAIQTICPKEFNLEVILLPELS